MDKIDVSQYRIDEDLKKQIDALKKRIKDDPEFYKLVKDMKASNKLVNDNIAKFADYQDDYNYCKNCPGLDKCAKDNPHMRLRLIIDGDLVSRNYSPCEKITDKIVENSLYLYTDYIDEWRNITYENLDKTKQRLEPLAKFVDIVEGTSNSWIYLYGNRKCGKSYFAAIMMNDYIRETKQQGAFIDMSKRMKQLGDLFYNDRPAYEKMFDNLATVPFLVIDNFGAEYKSDFSRDSILVPLLNARSNAQLPTIFVSTFSLNEIKELYSLKTKAGQISAASLIDLIKSMTEGAVYDLSSSVRIYK